MAKKKFDAYQMITDRVVEALEKGVSPWIKPWKSDDDGDYGFRMPVNVGTPSKPRPYNGVNVLLLWITASEKGYNDHRWLTFKQAKTLKGSVCKGEKGTRVTFFKNFQKKDRDTGELLFHSDGTPMKSFYLKLYTVFNVEQCMDLPKSLASVKPVVKPKPVNGEVTVNELMAGVEDWCEKTGAEISHGGSRAFYSITADSVTLPELQVFDSTAAYYSTKLHELVHWTGSKKRLGREFGQRFGDKAYAFEELVAELGSAFLCADHNVATVAAHEVTGLQHDNYLGHWLKILKGDKYAIFTASRSAREASEFLHEKVARVTKELEAKMETGEAAQAA